MASQLVAHLNPRSVSAESYRVLRTNLQYGRSGAAAAFTSGPREGKSTTLSNLAVAVATILTLRVDGVILVVRSRVARDDTVLQAKALLEHAHARTLGVVLNSVARRDDEYRYRYEYGGDGPGQAR